MPKTWKNKCVGRPLVDPTAGPRRFTISFRATESLRTRLEEDAAKTGLSLAQVIERRLLAAFEYEHTADYLRDALGLNPAGISGTEPECATRAISTGASNG